MNRIDMKMLLYFVMITMAVTVANAQRPKSVLLSRSEAKRLANQCSRPSPSDFTATWEPTRDQIKTMERRLKDIAKLKAEKCCIVGDRVEHPEEWYLQYAALVWQGRRIIYISGISTTEPEKGPCFDKDGVVTDEHCEFWKHHAEVVCDGGTQWGVIYDVRTGKFSELAVNGVG